MRWNSSDERSSALVGMQPQLRQMPPRCSRSTTAVFMPSCAARIAATYPPGPLPRTIRSKEVSAIWPSPPFSSQQHRQRIFDERLEGSQELRANSAVDGAVIAGEGTAHDRRHGDRAILDHRALLAGADRQDAAMRRIDDRGKVAHTVHAEI